MAASVIVGLFGGRRSARTMQCLNNLKGIGTALRTFATDHDGKWPMHLPAGTGGSHDSTHAPELLWRHFQILSNELGSPKILRCPTDNEKREAETFRSPPSHQDAVVFSGNQHLSYFLALNAVETDLHLNTPADVLAGDRNLSVDGQPVAAGRFTLASGQTLGFSRRGLHRNYGILLFADGSVWHGRSNRLSHVTSTTNLLLVP